MTNTCGTWGNNPAGAGNGLFENLEAGSVGDAVRSQHLDDAREARLCETIEEYRQKGEDAWEYLNPCSGFAADAWEQATGESLAHRRVIISNPSKLKASIEAANTDDMEKAAADDCTLDPPRSSGSPRSVGSSVAPCASCSGSSG